MDSLLHDVLSVLQSHHTDISSLIMTILTGVNESVAAALLLDNLLAASHKILVAFTQYPMAKTWISDHEQKIYARELQALTSTDNGWHFSALRARANQITEFHLDDMAAQMETTAPRLWQLLDALALCNTSKKRVRDNSDEAADTNEEKYWSELDGLEDENLDARAAPGTSKRASRRVVEKRRNDIRRIVSSCFTVSET